MGWLGQLLGEIFTVNVDDPDYIEKQSRRGVMNGREFRDYIAQYGYSCPDFIVRMSRDEMRENGASVWQATIKYNSGE